MRHSLFKVAVAGLAMALASGAAVAADFNGSWVRDTPAGNGPGYPVYWTTRMQPAGGGGNTAPYVMDVRQDAASVNVTDPVHPQRTYLLDGKPHPTTTDTMIAKGTATATASGETLTVATTQPYGGMPGNVPATETQTWSLSPDGKSLTISTVRNSPAQRLVFAEVYRRR